MTLTDCVATRTSPLSRESFISSLIAIIVVYQCRYTSVWRLWVLFADRKRLDLQCIRLEILFSFIDHIPCFLRWARSSGDKITGLVLEDVQTTVSICTGMYCTYQYIRVFICDLRSRKPQTTPITFESHQDRPVRHAWLECIRTTRRDSWKKSIEEISRYAILTFFETTKKHHNPRNLSWILDSRCLKIIYRSGVFHCEN